MVKHKYKLFKLEGCPHCDDLMSRLAKNKFKCDLEIIDCDKNPKKAEKYHIDAVPTILDCDGKEITSTEMFKRCKLNVK